MLRMVPEKLSATVNIDFILLTTYNVFCTFCHITWKNVPGSFKAKLRSVTDQQCFKNADKFNN